MASDNPKMMKFNNFNKWFKHQKKINKFKVKKVNLREIKNWKIRSDQPIILQNEVGILGIIKNPKTKKYLLQAKVEPGNINKLQLAPSVQATESNYKGAHGGKKVPYINFFLKLKNRKKYHQSEQGFRYLNKFNSNILINKRKFFKKENNFFWLSKEEIKKLILKKNIINMDTLSVFSTAVKKKFISQTSINSKKKVYRWFKKNDKKYYINCKKVKLVFLKDWIFNKYKIYHKNKKHFSVIGIDVKTSKRENNRWSQPILEGKKIAFAGFIKKNINNNEHYLCRYILKPGLKKSVVSCTVNTSDLLNFNKDKNLSSLDKNYIKNYFLKKNHKVEYDNILSEEGGRFYKCQIRYMIISVNFDKLNKIADNYIWLSHNQIIDLIENKRLDIESRLLFACGNIENIK